MKTKYLSWCAIYQAHKLSEISAEGVANVMMKQTHMINNDTCY